MNEVLELLGRRRSAKIALLKEPGPSASELDTILTIAARVPDHKRLVPWRFIVFEGDARARFGDVLAETLKKEATEAPSAMRLEMEQQRFQRAPLVIAVISRVKQAAGIPEIEQLLSGGAATFNLCLAANAMGYGTCWITEWCAFSPGINTALGLTAEERVAGFVYIGTESEKQPDRDRPVMGDIVSRWQG
ncbi:MAG: nitroreductase [Hyphomicrobiaceae bacterium]